MAGCDVPNYSSWDMFYCVLELQNNDIVNLFWLMSKKTLKKSALCILYACSSRSDSQTVLGNCYDYLNSSLWPWANSEIYSLEYSLSLSSMNHFVLNFLHSWFAFHALFVWNMTMNGYDTTLKSLFCLFWKLDWFLIGLNFPVMFI